MDKIVQFNMAQDGDEFSIWDFVDFLKQGWSWLAGGLVLGWLAFFIRRSW